MGRTVPELRRKPGEKVWYIRYQCQFRRHSRWISADTTNFKVAIKKLAEFIDLFEAGRVGLKFQFYKIETRTIGKGTT